MGDPRFEAAPPFSDVEISEIEAVLGRRLPDDYLEFVKQYGGAFVGGLVDGSEELPILTFFDAGNDRGVLSKLSAHPDLRGDSILPIADCELGNLYVLTKENAVYYIDYYGGKAASRKVSNSFHDFVTRIVISEEPGRAGQ
jgi:hypothetical protein